MARLLKMTGPCNTTAIVAEIEKKSQSVFGSWFGPERTYHEIVCQVADKLDIWYIRSETTAEVEVRIARKVLQTMWEKMTPAQRQQMEEQLSDVVQQLDDKGIRLAQSSGLFTLLLAGKLSGFGIYLLASTSLGAITGTLGVALPFAVYTTMSSMIAVVLGPVGWSAAALFAIWKLTGPDYPFLIQAILYVMMLRTKDNDPSQPGVAQPRPLPPSPPPITTETLPWEQRLEQHSQDVYHKPFDELNGAQQQTVFLEVHNREEEGK